MLSLLLLLTGALAAQLPHLEIDTRDEGFFHEDDPALIAYNDFREHFGQDEIFIIALKPKLGLTKEFIHTLNRLHNELEETVPYLDELTSLINGRVVRAEGDTLYVENLIEHPPASESDIEGIKALIKQYPLYENVLISNDNSMVSIIIKSLAIQEEQPEELLDGFSEEQTSQKTSPPRYLSNAQSMEISKSIQGIIAPYRSPDLKVYFTGTPAVVAALQTGVEKDLATIMPLSMLLIIFFLAILYKRISGIIYPLLIVSLSLLTTFGFMALASIPITLVSQILPSFLLIVGIADSVHILTIFYSNHNRHGDKRQAIIDAVGFAGLPILMTSITTACGLLSFAWSEVATISELGYVAPVGVFLAFFYTIVLLPVLIAIFPMKQKDVAVRTDNGQTSRVDRFFSWIAKVTTRYPIPIACIFGLLFAGSLYSATNVRFSHNISTWFPESSEIRIATEELDRVNGGSVMLEVLIDTGHDNGVHNPDFLQRLDQSITAISNLEVGGVKAGKVWALPDVIKETNRALHGNHKNSYIVPNNKELIAQELILFESSGSDDLEDFTDMNYRTARLSIMAPFADAVLYSAYVTSVEKILHEQFPTSTIVLTGKIKLFVQIITNALTSMTTSYAIALILITLLMIALVGRIRIGLMSMVANVGPVILIMGVMGLIGIPIDLSTILVGSLVLGIVVDDTIHILHHFRRAYGETNNVEQAVRETLFTTGRALLITSMVLCGGFFIYTLATLANNIRFGILTGTAILFALIADFFLVPALLSIVYKNNLGKKTT